MRLGDKRAPIEEEETVLNDEKQYFSLPFHTLVTGEKSQTLGGGR